jgi:hypothetical protein
MLNKNADLNQQSGIMTATGMKCRIMDGPISLVILKRASMISDNCTSVAPSINAVQKIWSSPCSKFWQSPILHQQPAEEKQNSGISSNYHFNLFFLEGSFLYFAFKTIFLIILAEKEEDGQMNLLIQPK